MNEIYDDMSSLVALLGPGGTIIQSDGSSFRYASRPTSNGAVVVEVEKHRKPWMTTPEAARYLRIGSGTLLKFVRSGCLMPSRLPTGAYRYSASQLDTFIENSGSDASPLAINKTA